MEIPKRLFVALLIGLLVLGCSSSEDTEQVGDAEEVIQTSPGVTIDFTLVVSGLPGFGAMTFNYEFITDGRTGRMGSESIIPAGEQERVSKLAYVTDIDGRTQTYMNSATKTYSTVTFPDSATVPPITHPEAEISVEPTGNVKELLGVQCSEVTISLEVSNETGQGTGTTSLKGNLWVNGDFEGYDAYMGFQRVSQDAIKHTRLQGSGYFEFLVRAGLSRENLNKFYEQLGGFPFQGELEFARAIGDAAPTVMTVKHEVTSASADPIDASVFTIPEDFTETDLRTVTMPGQ